jgi:tRNA G18 (ribose-2'-O)-methylase SpoU
MRSAAAFGVDAVLLDRTCADPLYRKAIRTSMGAALSVPFAEAEPWPEALRELAGVGRVLSDPPWVVLGMTPAASAPPLRAIAAEISSHPVVIVVGHEGDGLSDAALAACTHRARIPMMSDVDSLNVATAAAIAFYELTNGSRRR